METYFDMLEDNIEKVDQIGLRDRLQDVERLQRELTKPGAIWMSEDDEKKLSLLQRIEALKRVS